MRRIIAGVGIGFFGLTALACGFELGEPRNITGNFEVEYHDNMRVYINDKLVAEVVDGDTESMEWDGDIIELQVLCSEKGVQCPSENFWNEVAFTQPNGSGHALLNIVNLSEDRGRPGERIGGLLRENGSFEALSGFALDATGHCGGWGVGTVEGQFSGTGEHIDSGMIVYEFGAGCNIDGLVISGKLRLESDFTAFKTGALDLSSIEEDAPVDEEGEELPDMDP